MLDFSHASLSDRPKPTDASFQYSNGRIQLSKNRNRLELRILASIRSMESNPLVVPKLIAYALLLAATVFSMAIISGVIFLVAFQHAPVLISILILALLYVAFAVFSATFGRDMASAHLIIENNKISVRTYSYLLFRRTHKYDNYLGKCVGIVAEDSSSVSESTRKKKELLYGEKGFREQESRIVIHVRDGRRRQGYLLAQGLTLEESEWIVAVIKHFSEDARKLLNLKNSKSCSSKEQIYKKRKRHTWRFYSSELTLQERCTALWVALFLGLIGPYAYLISNYWYFQQSKLLQEQGREATATVKEHIYVSHYRSRTLYHRVELDDGTVAKTELNKKYPVGEQIQVIYLPEKPSVLAATQGRASLARIFFAHSNHIGPWRSIIAMLFTIACFKYFRIAVLG